MKWTKYSEALTKEARKTKRFKDRRSRIGIRPDGTLLIRLEGKDHSELRERVFERDNYTCVHAWRIVKNSSDLGRISKEFQGLIAVESA